MLGVCCDQRWTKSTGTDTPILVKVVSKSKCYLSKSIKTTAKNWITVYEHLYESITIFHSDRRPEIELNRGKKV